MRATLVSRLEGLLLRAVAQMRDRTDLREAFPHGVTTYDAWLSRIQEALLAAFKEAVQRRASLKRRDAPCDVNPAIKCTGRLRQGSCRTVVIVPMATASEQLQQSCLRSIARNFSPKDTVVVLSVVHADRFQLECLRCFRLIRLIHGRLFTLPHAYNTAVEFIRQESEFDCDDLLLVFMDDDAEIVGDQRTVLEHQMKRVRDRDFLVASGHYYDLRPDADFFARTIGCSGTRDFVSRIPKPYCHGGAAMMTRLDVFPSKPLPADGLGGISLGVKVIETLDRQWTGNLDTGEWYILNNPQLSVQHPRKADIIQWIATYSGYVLAWKAALESVDERWRKIWRARLSLGRQSRLAALRGLYQEPSLGIFALSNVLLTQYFKPLVAANIPYTDFMGQNLSCHLNLGTATSQRAFKGSDKAPSA
jgi:hypothetical protein